MGAAEKIDIAGAKGGSSSPKSPVEAADSLRSTNLAKILIAVGEGEFDGVPSAQNIYLDNTPINDASGNVNFPNVKWEWRTGAVDQTYIPGIPSVENETTVNVELRSDTSWVRSLTNTQLSAVRLRFAWPALQQQDDNGNVGGYRIEYAVDVATDGGAYQQVLDEAVDGKTTTRYERSRRIDLPPATSGWQIRVRRLTANQNTNKIADTMLVAGYTEVIDAKLRYPNTALLYIEFDAEQFTNIPAVTVDCNGRKWQVPSNYDPVTRSYTGVWDGTFKLAWTNNPAWITYGICTVDRFGLGKRIKPFMVDKWELYRIAQYCDQLVGNGAGGQEPRFLCDMNLQGKAEAWTLLRDISAIYRGMTYWAQGQLVAQADMPRTQDFDYVFTRANVIDGKFSYGSASSKTRYSRALVSFDNPANNYDTDVTAYSDPELQRRFGDKPVEISAIGCTRASEAQRRGKWVVMSNNQDRTVTFKTGMEGAIPLPGYIIPVADSLLAGREVGGRIAAGAGRVVTLDRDTLVKAGDRLIINLPSGKAEGRTVQSVSGRAITVTTAYSETPAAELQWALDADDLAIPLYRVLSTKRTTEGDYEIAAVQFEPSKFAFIDTGARLEERPISVIPITVVSAPASVTLTSNSAIAQGLAVTTMTIAWAAVAGAVGYDVEWRKDNGNWIKVQRTGATSVDITGIYSGAYLARVRAVSAYDISSIWRSSILTQLNGKEGLPPAVTSLTATPLVFGIGLKWTFPSGAEDTQRTEIWYGPTTDREAATKLSDLAYPQSEYTMSGLAAGVTFFFWARLVDRTGNIGPWYPVGIGVMGQSSADAGPILDYLAGQIGETELGQQLSDRIDLIDGAGPGSVNERLSDLSEQVSQVTDQLQEQIDQIGDIVDALEYDATKAYAQGDSVRVGQRLYQAAQSVPVNTSPPNPTYWIDVGQAVTTANGLAARVQTVETKVTSLEGTTTSQASQITGLQSSLTTTNQNVTAAQNAANAANTLAGGKGKVLVQSATPAAADQLSQNLWIDTTNNANTPKRWTGSAWTAVSDKAATDAAAAAANALAVAQTKADASAVDSLTTRVTSAEGNITSQGTAITGLTNSIGQMGGDNLLLNSSFEQLASDGIRPLGWQSNASATGMVMAQVDSPLALSTKAIRCSFTALANGGYIGVATNISDAERPKVAAGQSYTMSVYARASSPSGRLAMYIQWLDSANTLISTSQLAETAIGTTFGRYSFSAVAPTGAAKVNVYPARLINRSGVAADMWVEFDNAQLQEGATLTAYSPSVQAVTNAQAANSTAINSLDSRVTLTEGKVASQASSLQSLQASARGGDDEGELADALNVWSSAASAAQEVKVRAEQDYALAQRTTALDARVGTNESRITTVETTVATNQAATSTAIQQIQASVNDNAATILQTASAYADTAGKLSSMWSVKMQVNANGQYVAAGIGLGIENTGAGLQSQFLVSADRFAIVNTVAGGAISVPFAVQGGQAFLSSAFIQDGTITNAKIGSYISSTNYIAGQQGWILNKDGTLEINGAVAGQGRLVVNNQYVAVYDASGVLRVRMGYLG